MFEKRVGIGFTMVKSLACVQTRLCTQARNENLYEVCQAKPSAFLGLKVSEGLPYVVFENFRVIQPKPPSLPSSPFSGLIPIKYTLTAAFYTCRSSCDALCITFIAMVSVIWWNVIGYFFPASNEFLF